MFNIKENIFENYFKISQKIQFFEQRLKSTDVDSSVRQTLHKELESLQGSLETLQKTAEETNATFKEFTTQLKEIEDQVIYLYREIEECFEKHEISFISKEALEIGKGFETGTVLNIAKKIDDLKESIHFLFKQRCPSMQNRKIVQLALQLANSIHEVLHNKDSSSNFQAIVLLRELLEKALLEANAMINPEEGELAMELCEIAELYAQKKDSEGRSKLKEIRYLLTPEQKNQIDDALFENQDIEKTLLELAGASQLCNFV